MFFAARRDPGIPHTVSIVPFEGIGPLRFGIEPVAGATSTRVARARSRSSTATAAARGLSSFRASPSARRRHSGTRCWTISPADYETRRFRGSPRSAALAIGSDIRATSPCPAGFPLACALASDALLCCVASAMPKAPATRSASPSASCSGRPTEASSGATTATAGCPEARWEIREATTPGRRRPPLRVPRRRRVSVGHAAERPAASRAPPKATPTAGLPKRELAASACPVRPRSRQRLPRRGSMPAWKDRRRGG
jgi:hypothetical protein